MKHCYLFSGKALMAALFGVLFTMSAQANVVINKETFPDDVFRNYVMSEDIDWDQDRMLDEDELYYVTKIDVRRMHIKSLKGIEYFTELTWLSCRSNELTELDITRNTKLQRLFCWENQLTTLDVSKCPDLEYLECAFNLLTAIDVTKNPKLIRFNTEHNKLTSIDVSKQKVMKIFFCGENQLTALDVSNCTQLDSLYFNQNKIKSIDVSHNTKLKNLWIYENELTAIDVSKCTELESLVCYKNQLTSLNVSNCTKLNTLWCHENLLTELDVTTCSSLKSFHCHTNLLTTLDLSKNAVLEVANCPYNRLTTLTLCQNGSLQMLNCVCNQLAGTAMDNVIASLPNRENGAFRVFNTDSIKYEGNVCTTDQVAAAKEKGWTSFHWVNNQWEEYPGVVILRGIPIDEEHFPDDNYRSHLLAQDYGADAFLTYDEIDTIQTMEVGQKAINDLTGTGYLTALVKLYCNTNQLTTIDLHDNLLLDEIHCWQNNIRTAGMDSLVFNLPTVAHGLLYVYKKDKFESNEMTMEQVAAAKEKGWTPLYYDFSDSTWKEYHELVRGIPITKKYFPDDNFRSHLLAQGYGADAFLTYEEIDTIKTMVVSKKEIENLLGMQYLTALDTLDCVGNKLDSLIVSKNKKLTMISCYNNSINEAEMGKLVESLPTVESGTIVVMNLDDSAEENEITKEQIQAAKSKGWRVMALKDNQWVDYDGPEPDGIHNVNGNTAAAAPWYTIDGRQLQSKPIRTGIYIQNGRKVVIR